MRELRLFIVLSCVVASASGCGGAGSAGPETPNGDPATGSAAATTAPATGDAPATATATGQASKAPAGAAPSAAATAAPVDEPLLGKLADSDVYATLNKNYALFGPCYPDALKKKNGSIKVQLRPTIGPTGKVNDAKVSKTSGDAKFDACALEAFKKIQFPASRGSAFVNPTWVELGGEKIETQ